MPEGLWQKCPGCAEMIDNIELEDNFRVCPRCDYHFRETPRQRIAQLFDADSFREHDATLAPIDTLQFTGLVPYAESIKRHQKKNATPDAAISGVGKIEGREVGIALMDFGFMGGSMGSVIGEKITRIIEHCTAHKFPVIIVSASGGARMQEGLLSLMQMAKTCGALARHAEARLPYISLLTDPTTGGVSASFATVGDLNIAEPRAMIGFAGPRVIKETTHQDLPAGFQTAEFLKEHGLIDMIVHRKKLRATLARIFDYFCAAKAA